MDELGVTTRLQLGAALVRSDTLRGGSRVTRAPEKPRPRSRGTAGVAQGEKIRAASGKVRTALPAGTHITGASGNVRYPGFLTEDLVLAA